MGRRHALKLAFAAMLGALAILALPALASAKDRNHDRIPDRWEQRHHLSLNVNQSNRDQDNDGLDNRGEFRAGDDPRNHDSDDDGVMDGEENAGTISAFDATTGKLTIALFGGDSVSGLVTTETEIKCEGPDNNGSASVSRDHGGSGPGSDNSGRGEEEPGDDHGEGVEPGDDNGGRGEEQPGDDHGGDNSGPGSSNSGPGRGDEGNVEEASCTTANLVVGAVVHEADLQVSNGLASFDEVELAHTS
jgi:hypothetical protein